MNLSPQPQVQQPQIQQPFSAGRGHHIYADPLPPPRAGSGQPQKVTQGVPLDATGSVPFKQRLWRQTVAVCNSRGEEEAFTVGPDGCVWNFFRDPAVESGYSLINLNMPTDALAVSHDGDGRMVVFSASGMTLLYRIELPSSPGKPQSTAAQRWSAVMEVALPLVLGAVAVKRLFVTDVFDAMHIGAVVHLQTSDQREGYVMAYAKWTVNGLTFPEPSILLDGDPRRSRPMGSSSQFGTSDESRYGPDSAGSSDSSNSADRSPSRSGYSDSRRISGPTDTTYPGELPLRSVLVRPWRIGVKTDLYQ